MEQSVQELLEAERESRAIIESAQKERNKKVGEAKVFAEQEINRHRKEYEEKYLTEVDEKKRENEALSKYDDEMRTEIQNS